MSMEDAIGRAIRILTTLPIERLGVVCELLEKLIDPEWFEATKRFIEEEELINKKRRLRHIFSVELTKINRPQLLDLDIESGFREGFGEDALKKAARRSKSSVGFHNVHQLDSESQDSSIVSELGSKDIVVETKLDQALRIVLGEEQEKFNIPLGSGKDVVFYIRNKKDALWAVYFSKCRGRLRVNAHPYKHPHFWSIGSWIVTNRI